MAGTGANSHPQDTSPPLKSILKGKVVLVGVGNTLRGDDGFGPALVARLSGKSEAVCIDAGTVPENYLGEIVRQNPDTVLLVDATHLGLNPGDYAILRKDEIAESGFTTHDMSPNFFIEHLEKETGAAIYVLALQPAHVSFGAEMSAGVQETLEELVELLSA